MITTFPPGSDIFASSAQALVSPVDCTGAQGAGLALLFKKRYPVQCAAFKSRARAGGIEIGRPWYAARANIEDGLLVFCPTKTHWSRPSALEDVASSARALVPMIFKFPNGEQRNRLLCRSIAIPALGCGLGELAWADVKPVLDEVAATLDAGGVAVELYEPHPRKGRGQ